MYSYAYDCDYTEELNEISDNFKKEVTDTINKLVSEFIENTKKIVGEKNIKILESSYIYSVFIDIYNTCDTSIINKLYVDLCNKVIDIIDLYKNL